MKLFIRIIKYVVLSIAVITALLAIGIPTIQKQVRIEEKESSYKLTKFDYLVTGMSKAQVQEFREKTDTIQAVFPVINFEVGFTATNNLSINLNILASDDMNQFENGLFNQSLLLEGSFSEDGIMVDRNFADKLGLTIGSDVSFKIMDKPFTKQVTAIYRASTYKGLDTGVAVMKLTDEIVNLYSTDKRYDLSFIVAKDIEKCEAYLSTYVPKRNLIDQDTYIEKLKKANAVIRVKGMTDEEYEAAYVALYQQYYDNYISKDYSSSVHVKSDFLVDIEEQTSTIHEEISATSIITSIATAIVFAIAYFIFLYRDNRVILRESSLGQEKTKIANKVSIPAIASGLCVGLIVLITLAIYSATQIYSPSYVKIVVLFSVPSLALVAIAIPCSYLLVGQSFQKAKRSTEQVDTHKEEEDNSNALYSRFDVVLFLRKRAMLFISVLITSIAMIIAFVAFAGSTVKYASNYQRFRTVGDDAIYAMAKEDKDTFINYDNENIVVLNKSNIRISADIYGVIPTMVYSDNLLFYTGGLKDMECAVSQNLLEEYHLRKGDTVSISGKDYKYTITMILDAQSGVDNKYVHDGVILLGYNTNLENELNEYYSGSNSTRTIYYFVSLDKTEMMFPAKDTTRDNPYIFAKTVMAEATGKIILNAAYTLLIFIVIVAVIDIFLSKSSKYNLSIQYRNGKEKNKILLTSVITNLIMFAAPYILILLFFAIKYGGYGSSYIIPYMLIGFIIILLTLGYSYYYYWKVITWKKNKKK